jgi:hypothetical protein
VVEVDALRLECRAPVTALRRAGELDGAAGRHHLQGALHDRAVVVVQVGLGRDWMAAEVGRRRRSARAPG